MDKSKLNIGSRCRVIEGRDEGRVVKITNTEIDNDGCYAEHQNGERRFCLFKDLELLKPSLDTLFVGDVVVDNRDYEHLVLGICGKIVFLDNATDGMTGRSFTFKELKQDGYTFKSSEKKHHLCYPECPCHSSEEEKCKECDRYVKICICYDPLNYIEINNKKYNRDEVEERVKGLKEII